MGWEVVPGGIVAGRVGAIVFDRPRSSPGSSRCFTRSSVGVWSNGGTDWRPRVELAVVEVPLLFETSMEDAFDATVAVTAADETRARRAGLRGTELLESRSDRQLPQEEKAARATYVLATMTRSTHSSERWPRSWTTDATDTIQPMSPARTAAEDRRRPTRAQARRRRWTWFVIAALLGVGIAVGISKIDVQQAIRDITLPLQHDDIIRQQAADKNLDPAMVAAVIYSESRFRDQESRAGALGLMQITPETAL